MWGKTEEIIEWILISYPFVITEVHKLLLINTLLFIVGILLTFFGRYSSQTRFYKQVKYKLFLRSSSEDGFIYPLVLFPTIILSNCETYPDVINTACVALTSSLAIGLFSVYICFGTVIFLPTLAIAMCCVLLSFNVNILLQIMSLAIVFAFVFLKFIQCFANSFTFGEAGLIVQAVFTVAFIFIEEVLNFYVGTFQKYNDYPHFVLILIGSAIFTIISLSPVLYINAKFNKTNMDGLIASLSFYISLILNIAIIFIPATVYLMEKNPLEWLVLISLERRFRVGLILYWGVLVLASLLVVIWFSNAKKNPPKTIIRKIFHVIAVLIYAPMYRDLQYFAVVTSIIFVLFIGIEMVRVFKIQPFSILLDRYMEPFRESQDVGKLIMTPIYLLAGLSLPIWLTLFEEDLEVGGDFFKLLQMYAGVLSLGVGDTCASIFGKLYGRKTWPNSSKTIFGTMVSFVAQMFFSFFLAFMLNYKLEIYHVLLTVLLCFSVSLLEGVSSQVDNLILPIYTYVLCKLFGSMALKSL